MHTSSDAHIHLVDRHGTLRWTPEKSAKLSNMSCQRFDHDRAICLNNKTQAITGVNAEMFAHFLRNGDLALCRQRCCVLKNRQLALGGLRFFSTSASVIIIIIGSTGHS